MEVEVKKNIRAREHTTVPIYDLDLWLIVAKDAVAARKTFDPLLGVYDGGDFRALACYNDFRFAIFFHAHSVDHAIVSHEIMHVATRMLDFVGQDFHPHNHECYTYLTGWITAWVYRQLKKAKIRVTT